MRIHLPADQEQKCKKDPGQPQDQQSIPVRTPPADVYSSAATKDLNTTVSTHIGCFAAAGVDQHNGPKVSGNADLIAGITLNGLVYEECIKVGAGEQMNGLDLELVISSKPDGTIIDLGKLGSQYKGCKFILSESNGPGKVCAVQWNGPRVKMVGYGTQM